MDALLIWYLACGAGCAVAVYRNTHTPAQEPPKQARALPKWMADMTAYPEPLDGYQDPIFETSPMELERASKH